MSSGHGSALGALIVSGADLDLFQQLDASSGDKWLVVPVEFLSLLELDMRLIAL